MDQLRSISLQGPATVAPGETRAYTVLAEYFSGRTDVLSDRAHWVSSAESVLTVDASGRATGHAAGESRLRVQVGGLFSTRDVVVVPHGTFRLSGIVTEADASTIAVPDARVEASGGDPGALLSATASRDGRYSLYGLAGGVEIRVSRDGYQTSVSRLVVQDHVTHDIALTALPRPSIAGRYSLRVEADAACRDRLPERARERTYVATVTQSGPLIDVRLSGANFATTRSGAGDRFRGRLEPQGIIVVLANHLYRYYSYAQYPDIVELLDGPGWLAVDGTVTMAETARGYGGWLSGAVQFFGSDPAWGGTPSATCQGRHLFSLERST